MVVFTCALLLIWFSLPSSLTRAALPISDVSSSNTSSPFTPLDQTARPSTAFPVNSDANVTTIKNTTVLIRDSNGVDITSSFQIKVYNPSSAKQITNMSESSQLNERQTGGVMNEVVKVINRCPRENMTFIESHCNPHDEEYPPGQPSMQAFMYVCEKVVDLWRYSTGEYLGRGPVQEHFKGECQPTEFCVDRFGDKQIASCVHTSLFDDFQFEKDGTIKGMLNQEIFDVGQAWAAISNKDPENAAVTARKLRIGAWNSASMAMKGKMQSKSCVNCMELETDLLKPDTDSLRLEATLMSAGAIGGILWLALGAG